LGRWQVIAVLLLQSLGYDTMLSANISRCAALDVFDPKSPEQVHPVYR
jgi:hypothetical protein